MIITVKKGVFLLMLTAIIVNMVFAQAPTLDKLRFNNMTSEGQPAAGVGAANKTISGAVVIPDTAPNGRNVRLTISSGFADCTGITSVSIPNSMTRIDNVTFNGCTGLTSISIPASITIIGVRAFAGCTSLTSVTFLGSSVQINDSTFPGDLQAKYKTGGAGTYTRPAGSNTWTRTGDAPAAPPPTPVINTSLNGIWDVGGALVTINGNTCVFNSFGTVSGLLQDAVNKNYYTLGGQYLRNITSTGTLTWSGQIMNITYNTNRPNVATGTNWANCTIAMNADGRTITVNSATWTRR